jgi:single-strand DNA-binding protein
MTDAISQVLRASVHRFIGRLARDPEVRFFDSGMCVANTRIAVNRPGAKKDDGQEPDWFKIEVWGEKAQAFADGVRKGQLVDVTGRVRTEQWPDRNTGEVRRQLCITVEQWSPVNVPARAAAPAATARPTPTTSGWESTAGGDVDDIPF